MFNSSPIDAWEGAGAIFNSAGSGGVGVWFLILCVLGVLPVIGALRHDSKADLEHGG